MSFSSAERSKLAHLMHELGPDAATLCEGWTTRDMAVHLYVRENHPVRALGMFISPLESGLNKAYEKYRQQDYDSVVDMWAKGSGPLSPMRYLDSMINTAEHFVHHEDVRRGDGSIEVRDFSAAANDQLYAALRRMAPTMLKGADKPVILTAEGYAPISAGGKRGVVDRGDNVMRVSGDVGELLLWAFGRSAVKVEIDEP